MEYDDYEEGEVRDDEEEDQGGHKDPGQSSKYWTWYSAADDTLHVSAKAEETVAKESGESIKW